MPHENTLRSGTPLPLRAFLRNHNVFTLNYLGWSTLANGQLLNKAESECFDCRITTDRNLKYQQNLVTRRIAIFVLSTTNWTRIKPRALDIAAEIDKLIPKSYIEFIV